MIKKGFTLIELLVVVLIIGILAAVAIPQYTKAVDKSRMSEALVNIKALWSAAERFKLETGAYPEAFDELDIEIPGTKNGAAIETKNFQYLIHDYNNDKAHIQGVMLKKSAYIIVYLKEQKISCVAPNADKAGNDLCRTFSTTIDEDCVEAGYRCYRL